MRVLSCDTHTLPPSGVRTLRAHAQLCPLPAISFLRIPAGSDQERWRGRMEELSNLTLWLSGHGRGGSGEAKHLASLLP